jgi:hypothetical protein
MAVKMTVWALQVTLAVACFACGRVLLGAVPDPGVRIDLLLPRWCQLLLGAAVLAAAAGLTLPGVTRIMPWLVRWAALGVMIVTASAALFHLARGEISSAVNTLIFCALATVVAHMRTPA